MKASREVIAARYKAWAESPRETQEEAAYRDVLWNLYCDARDGLPDGVSAGKEREPCPLQAVQRAPHRRNLALVT